MPNNARAWLGPIRAPFLLLPLVLILVGGGAAYADGLLRLDRLLLCLVGVTLAHAAVNMFNEHSDHRTGIDLHTRRTPFSGGSGTLQAGTLTPRQVGWAAVLALAAAFLIALYLSSAAGWPIMAFAVLGALAAVFYTTHLARWVLGELAAGICLGTLVVLGTYYAMASSLTTPVLIASLPPGILTALLLFLNEFPDLEADRRGGRRHLVILLGRKRAAGVYVAALAAGYLIIAGGAAAGLLPGAALLALLTLPLAVKASFTALRRHESFEAMVPALGANVGVVLGTDLLLALGFFLK